jgi:D-alanyl-lipoteichoic acid acyltransferase DltB (MBOAT superfamily)
MSYTLDVYRRKIEPTRDFMAFCAFVAFFPQLVAGPIERATHLLPQFYVKRQFDYSQSVDGMRQILWGLFKKIVIADNCAEYANSIFNHSDEYQGGILALAAIFFAFQIYADFSGYSDIAIGLGKLFGFELMQNFAYPYFSRDIAEFWRRWHISLTTWFRDYVYIPLGGQSGEYWVKNPKYLDYIYFKWALARCQLDIYCMGRFKCPLFFAAFAYQPPPQALDSGGIGQNLADNSRVFTNAIDFWLGGICVDIFSSRNYRPRQAIHLCDV